MISTLFYGDAIHWGDERPAFAAWGRDGPIFAVKRRFDALRASARRLRPRLYVGLEALDKGLNRRSVPFQAPTYQDGVLSRHVRVLAVFKKMYLDAGR